MLKKICSQSHGNLLRTTCSMRFPHPIFTHPILQFLEKCKTLQTLNQVHAQMITTGLALHTYPVSRLLFFSSSLAFSYALSIFNQTMKPTIFLYNTIISSFCNKKQYIHIALSLYNRILTHTTFKPNSHTFPSLFKACGSHPWLDHGRALHAHVLKFLEPSYDHFVQASLLNYYANYGKLDVARYLFDEITQPDLAVWNSILAAYARIGSRVSSEDDIANFSLEAFHLFREMQNSEVRPNEVTLVALISACANLAAFGQGAWAHVYVMNNHLRLNHYVGTALIEMYSKCGYPELAHQLFDKLPSKDTLCYNAMIGGLAIHGHGNRALGLYDKMKLEGIPPDDVTFIVTMFACSHVGLVEEGCKIFESIEEVYKFEPKVEHYCCLIDLLGRAGRVKEAEEKVRKMPMKPNAVLWRSLLGAARIHGYLEVGEIALKHLGELEPETSGNYVLLSNMYASIGGWDDVKRLRKFMKDQRVNKMPGTSVLDIGGATHEFLAGDKTHPRSLEIYLKLEEMNKELQNYGYKPRTKEVLFDIEEEEKEDALSYHSERLAIAYALLVSDSSAPIRIIKNLRVCSDCHSSSKIISVIYGREIIVRDRNRFHHFKDGSCSCLDYW